MHVNFRTARAVIDLSHTLRIAMPVWPTHPAIKFSYAKRIEIDNYTLTRVDCMTTHTGTHVDAPFHFLPRGKTIDEIEVSRFVGMGVVLDLSFKKSGEEITKDDLQRHDFKIRKGDVLMLYTGWGRKYGINEDYLFLWPHLCTEAADYLASKRIKAVGIDALSIAGWGETVPAHGPVAKSPSSEVHEKLLSKSILIIEELTNLDLVLMKARGGRALFVFAPLSFAGAEAGPCRALAFV
jgi:arylformamidase